MIIDDPAWLDDMKRSPGLRACLESSQARGNPTSRLEDHLVARPAALQIEEPHRLCIDDGAQGYGAVPCVPLATRCSSGNRRR
jgi:hypothetical protein